MSPVYLSRLEVHFISGLDLWVNGGITTSLSLLVRWSVLQQGDG
jgi:hypothetical protein